MWTLRVPAAWRRHAVVMRLMCDWTVPCMLCEDDVEHVSVYRDETTRKEVVERIGLDHQCEPLRGLMRERRA